MLLGSITRGDLKGVLVRMGNSTRNFDIKSGTDRTAAGYDKFLSDADVDDAATYPTDLNALSVEAFDRVARHGHEIADLTLTKYATNFENSPVARS
jgi:NTE family protein